MSDDTAPRWARSWSAVVPSNDRIMDITAVVMLAAVFIGVVSFVFGAVITIALHGFGVEGDTVRELKRGFPVTALLLSFIAINYYAHSRTEADR